MEIDEKELKRIEADLVDRVRREAKKDILKAYFAAGSLVLLILSYVGYDVVRGLNTRADTIAKQAVQEAVAKAESAADEASRAADVSKIRVGMVDDYLDRREAALSASESRSAERQAKLNQIAATVNISIDEMRTSLDGMQGKIVETEQSLGSTLSAIDKSKSELAEITSQFDALQGRTAALAGAGNLETMASQVAELGLQMQTLVDQVETLEGRAGIASMPSAAADKTTLNRVVEQVQMQIAPEPVMIADAGPLATVYFQFAGAERAVAEKISDRLSDVGYNMPGEERIKLAADKHEVRYFFEDDAWIAEDLMNTLNEILLEMGLQSDVIVSDQTTYRGAKPRLGTIELWLEPKAAQG